MYKATYKCRMCGETFAHESVSNNMEATAITAMIAINGCHKFKCHTFTENAMHDCPGDSIGYADFMGFRKENNDG